VVNATIVDKEKYKEEMSEFKKFLDHLSPTDFNVRRDRQRKLISGSLDPPKETRWAASPRRRAAWP